MDLLWISVFCLILSVTQPFAESQSTTGSSYECFRTVVQPLSRQCAPEFAIDGKFCIRTEIKYSKIQPVPGCLPGYTFSNENNRCYRMTNTSICVPPSCPHGYKLNGSLCIVDSSVSSVSSFSCVADCQCPDGFSFDGVFCAKNNFKCPLDYPFSYYSCGRISASTTCCLPLNIQQSFEYRLEIYRVNATIPRPPTTNVPPSKPLQCSAGSVLIGNCCRGFIDVQDIQPPTEICTNGYYLENHQCLKQLTIVTKQPPEIQCPPGTIKSDCECLMEKCCNGTESTTTTQPPTSPTSPPWTTLPTSPPWTSSTSNTTTSQTNYTCWGGSCYINNVNSVNVATNVNANSATNVLVHHTEGGETSIQIHNETTNQQGTSPGTPPGTPPSITPGTTPSTESPSTSTVGYPCCVIVSPRQCKETDNGTWHCFHRKKRVCLPICSQWSIIYLQPRQIIYQPPIMIVPPVRVPPMYCRGCSHRRLHDCSGCYSRGFCPQYCSNYECSSADCNFISQETFCHDYPGEMCSHDYGCFEEYCRN